MSSFKGFIKEISGISVDSFLPANIKNSSIFFLSHCHTDHMGGLRDTNFMQILYERKSSYLYCSEMTAILLRNMPAYSALSPKIKTLTLSSPTLVKVPCLEQNEGFDQEILVTLFPAGHCPGSTMFLFETKNGNILYTGDFRINKDELAKFMHLHHNDGLVKDLNCLYLDTTFWNQDQEEFPSRRESLEIIIKLMIEWWEKESNGHIQIDRPARFGSEFLMCALAQAFKTKIHVTKEVFRLYEGIAEIEDVLTVNSNFTKIHMCEQFGPGVKKRVMNCVPYYEPVLHIRPTAQWYVLGGVKMPYLYNSSKCLVQVCLSMHASKKELKDVVSYLKPGEVVACVVAENLQEEMEKELNSLLYSDLKTESVMT